MVVRSGVKKHVEGCGNVFFLSEVSKAGKVKIEEEVGSFIFFKRGS